MFCRTAEPWPHTSDMTATVAIVGRPNVGKSTLFNRLIGRRLAIVDDAPGVTRDWREGDASLGDLRFRVVDTAGLDPSPNEGLEAAVRRQTERAIQAADLILFVIDARVGVTPVDEEFAGWLRRTQTPVILVANKCEGRTARGGILDSFALGLGEPVPISAEHGEGMADLYEAVEPFVDVADQPEPDEDRGEPEETSTGEDEEAEARPLQLAIVGRPNVGKSSLLNRLVREERVLTGPEPGVTRDAIAVEWTWQGRGVRLIDTAGLRRRTRVVDRVERLSAEDTRRAIRFAEVVVLVLDATLTVDRQDLAIARSVIDEGRALVLAANKWDLVEAPGEKLAEIRDRIETSLSQVRGIPLVTISALTGQRLDQLMQAVFDIYEVWNRRVATGSLNRWLADALDRHPPPMVSGRRLRIRYATQIKRRPPTFVLFTTRPAEMPEDYLRYLANSLRETFGLEGVPLRIQWRKGENPYTDR